MTTILVLSSVLVLALCVAASFDLDLSRHTAVGGPIIGAIMGAVGHHLASDWLARWKVEESQANRSGEIGPALRQSDEVLNRLRNGIKDDPTGREFFFYACNSLGRRHGPLSFVVGRDFVRFVRMLEQLASVGLVHDLTGRAGRFCTGRISQELFAILRRGDGVAG